MRIPANERAAPEADALAPARPAPQEPERRCILSGAHGARADLIRLALGPDGRVWPDVRARAPGRGAWISVDRADLEIAIAKGRLKGALTRAFRATADRPVIVPEDLGDQLADALERAALERLGLEARASTLLTGTDRIVDAARRGRVRLLLHAADAAEDGRARLAQSWRVGMGEEGSGRQGLVLAANRPILSRSLGRDNVVHIAVIDSRAAERVAAVVDRWHRFIGCPTTGWPCGKPPQGSGPVDARDEQMRQGAEAGRDRPMLPAEGGEGSGR